MSFASLITPTQIPAQWTAAVDAGRVPQAVLVAGPVGAELLPLALKLVGYAQCTNPQRPAGLGFGESCTTCEACRSHLQLVHPDVHFTFPVVGKDFTSARLLPKWRTQVLQNPYLSVIEWTEAHTTENKLGNINLAEITNILHDINLQRFSSGYKVVLIWAAEYLEEDSNRLLKLIEEPPARTLIVLVTEHFNRMLPTITSRCRIFRVPPPTAEGIAGLLVQKGIIAQRADTLAYAAGGDVSRALASAEEDENAGLDLAGWFRACFTGKGAAIVQTAAAISKLTREQQKDFIGAGLRFVRELGVVRAGEPFALKLSAADRDVARKLATLTDWPQLAALSEELDALLVAITRNANGKVAFTAASVRIHRILAAGSK